MQTCPDEYRWDHLFKLIDSASKDRVKVPLSDIQIISDCFIGPENRTLENELRKEEVRGSKTKITVDRQAMFRFLVAHDKHHAKLERKVVVMDDPRCSCPSCVKIRAARGVPQPAAAVVQSVAPTPPKPKTAGDELSLALKDYFTVKPEDRASRFEALCKDNGIDWKKFKGREFGLARMALGNELRAILKRGDKVVVGPRTLK